MAQWQSLQQLDSALQNRVKQLYEGRFPLEIRHWACDLIETRDWDSAAVDENAARTCFHVLLECLDEQWNRSVQENTILQAPNFGWMKNFLLEHLQNDCSNLARVLSDCLKEEKKILDLAAATPICSDQSVVPQKWKELDHNVSELKRKILELKKEIKTLESLNEKLDFIQKTWQSNAVEQNIQPVQIQAQMEQGCLNQAMFITQTKQIVLNQLVNLLNQASQTVATLTDVELPEWKRRQQLACIGSPVDTSLELLQKWFTAVAEVLLGVRDQLQKLQDQNNIYSPTDASNFSASIAAIDKFVLSNVTKLLTNALVVEKQPVMQKLPQRPLILKTGNRFRVTVRFLANLPDFRCLLKVKPVFDKDVEEVKSVSGFRLFDFTTDNSKVLDVDAPDGGLMAEFEHMSLREKLKRSKALSENPVGVTEELHILRFVTVLHHAGQTFNIEASSLPVVVVTSSSQVPSAWASIMWWNMVSTSEPMNLLLFADPPPISWQQLSQLLSWQFLSVGQRGLDGDQLSMLRDKLLSDPEGLVHWSKFSKDESVWIWIDGILDLIKKYFADLWRDGAIMGFVSRHRTSVLLQDKPTGTFLIRFSESIRDGAITFSWVDHSSGETHVHAVQPYTKKELSVLPLPDAINHYSLTAHGKSFNPLVYLYPDIPKDTAFQRYYNVSGLFVCLFVLGAAPTKKNTTDYVGRNLASVSINPTPPPSPPREAPIYEDNNVNNNPLLPGVNCMDNNFDDLLDLPEDIFCPSNQLQPLSLRDAFNDPLLSDPNMMDH
ncbi:signal transducer and activator of transcription 1-alpha/beta-like isoform X1 [Kryptolebias marmoratus]|uniref:signal transducer and activator of transcription 1-alpha/beta-like isoform X1 n=1 Tax=Kryptolebias marmoratus TaxID=37003 RepID=UPI0018ACCD3F|nr:signal transducer and activator of transcription 1-alpha/beta-like isoform X1 [Kryptolebias marmoratus]XP_037832157.1 signal transducer and activator of transcription 1-alpha/beta-like isoform X1 [Kryptolebias marmoratus]